MVPEKYITQLIEDMVAAHKKQKDRLSDHNASSGKQEDDFLAHIQDVENYLDFDDKNSATLRILDKFESQKATS